MRYFIVNYKMYYPLMKKVINRRYVTRRENFLMQEDIETNLRISIKKYRPDATVLNISQVEEITEYEYNDLIPG